MSREYCISNNNKNRCHYLFVYLSSYLSNNVGSNISIYPNFTSPHLTSPHFILRGTRIATLNVVQPQSNHLSFILFLSFFLPLTLPLPSPLPLLFQRSLCTCVCVDKYQCSVFLSFLFFIIYFIYYCHMYVCNVQLTNIIYIYIDIINICISLFLLLILYSV